jgi:hypothetical protein
MLADALAEHLSAQRPDENAEHVLRSFGHGVQAHTVELEQVVFLHGVRDAPREPVDCRHDDDVERAAACGLPECLEARAEDIAPRHLLVGEDADHRPTLLLVTQEFRRPRHHTLSSASGALNERPTWRQSSTVPGRIWV